MVKNFKDITNKTLENFLIKRIKMSDFTFRIKK